MSSLPQSDDPGSRRVSLEPVENPTHDDNPMYYDVIGTVALSFEVETNKAVPAVGDVVHLSVPCRVSVAFLRRILCGRYCCDCPADGIFLPHTSTMFRLDPELYECP